MRPPTLTTSEVEEANSPRFTVQQIFLLQKLKQSGLSRDDMLKGLDELDKNDDIPASPLDQPEVKQTKPPSLSYPKQQQLMINAVIPTSLRDIIRPKDHGTPSRSPTCVKANGQSVCNDYEYLKAHMQANKGQTPMKSRNSPPADKSVTVRNTKLCDMNNIDYVVPEVHAISMENKKTDGAKRYMLWCNFKNFSPPDQRWRSENSSESSWVRDEESFGFEDSRMTLGTNIPIFGGGKSPDVSLQLGVDEVKKDLHGTDKLKEELQKFCAEIEETRNLIWTRFRLRALQSRNMGSSGTGSLY